ncbi:neutral zinc metallopeptidase [Parvularcula sp. LCG005]|uniref:KPN_02809 family neutral zinc metallopeptidase n=1 Tax=Parvularcula sp. LCG005 TaxID=3078805 RepID=UPI00294216B9|nr:neutral zinc metallopeptidase [Parvularcula sp. LCG005]WOI53150.1 neutral zinc metallopeptidase [Parvularcula sp. LCG005]
MRWENQRRSQNIENRRGAARTAGGLGIAFTLLRFIFGRFGIMGIVVVVGAYFGLKAIGIDALSLIAGGPAQTARQGEEITSEYDDMVAAVLGGTEDVWTTVFREQGYGDYPEPTLAFFTQGVQTACGYAPSSVGPFYCPGDRNVYLDTSFFDELQRRFGVQGDFPPAYVIAHEVGHHVQTVLGISDQVRQAQRGASQTVSNQTQVRMELQADCFAGLWAHNWRQGLEEGDIQEAMRAAAAIGDDALQRQSGARQVNPDSFTHGTSDQRMRWFSAGYQSGDFARCDTFSMDYSRL